MPCTRSLSQAHRHRLTPAPLCGILLFIGWGMAALSNALRITSAGPQTVHVAENDEVQIGCIYRLDSTDTGSLDIEWSIVSPDTTKQDRMILTYVHEQVFDYPNPLLGRFEFSESDPSAGNASVRIRALQTSDTNTFQCKVKKAPGIDTRKVTVRVHGRPQDPECWMDRSGDRGQDVRLHCVSHSGSPPLTYSWDRISSNSQELPAHSIADRVSGTLVIRNSSAQWDGTYRCSVRNLVGQAECQLLISAAPAAGDNKAGMIIGAVLGALLGLLLLMLLLWLLCCCCRRHRPNKDRPFNIREDSPPPVSRVSSVRSVRSYKTHQARKARDSTYY